MMDKSKPAAALDFITVSRCREHNLKDISLRIPLNRLTLVCGVSGSGKSTLAHDVLFSEGQGRFLESFSAYARIFQARMNRSRSETIANIPPALALGQRLALNNPRSTVSTLTDLHSPIRMLYSRCGDHAGAEKTTRSHLSFNHPLGACPACQGLGQVYEIDHSALITDEARSLRQGALSLSTPNGYIIYSQVTIDALDQVCRAHGFSVDVPWTELTDEQKHVVLYGSDRVQIPFGKHPLSSRLKWTGITPQPRALGFYRGIVPIMEEILRRDPNPNILRFCKQGTCQDCGGLRLAQRSLDICFQGTSLGTLLGFSISQLADWGQKQSSRPGLSRPERFILSELNMQAEMLKSLSLGHLLLRRAVPTLSRSEGQRIQIANLLKNPISGMLYVLDEPGSGLHPNEKIFLYRQLSNLLSIGSTVIMVSHDRQALAFADWVVELGPGGGEKGGHLLFCGPAERYAGNPISPGPETPTTSAWRRPARPLNAQVQPLPSFISAGAMVMNGLTVGALKFPARAITVVSGPSGSGKSTLLDHVHRLGATGLSGDHAPARIVSVDQQPLGKNARSNPATYTKLFDDIRLLFASQCGARELGLNASSFSFNTDQGCCPACQGAGLIEITMHYLQSLFQPCPQCQGRRYQDNVLAFRVRGKAIDEVLDLTIDQALDFFAAESRIRARLTTLSELGLGYLTLGQPSSTLSGGEAQRVRLASFIQNDKVKHCLYLLDEPGQGLHDQDIPFLVRALKKLVRQGATLLVAENNPLFIAGCDWLIELSGPENGNSLLVQGALRDVLNDGRSLVAPMLAGEEGPQQGAAINGADHQAKDEAAFIRMRGVRTHNLKNISVTFPERSFTVVSGPSGSGKSSLVLETLYKACQRRYAERLSPYLRDRLALAGEGEYDEITPLKPAVALAARYLETTPRSTVGTLSGIHDALRVFYSRLGRCDAQAGIPALHASHFSFNHHDGACPVCSGLGFVHEADLSPWLVDSGKGILDGAFANEKSCRFFLDPHGRHMAVLQSAARELGIDLAPSWRDLESRARDLILEGSSGDFAVTWKFRRGQRGGEQRFHSPWIGLKRLVLQDHQQKKEHRRKHGLYRDVVFKKDCPACHGLRLRESMLRCRVGEIALAEVLSAPLTRLAEWFENDGQAFFSATRPEKERLVCAEIMPVLSRRLRTLIDLGIGYLTLSRSVNTLSSGEHQRLRLASLLANRLNHTLFIMDEMSRGLHPLDVGNLLVHLRRLLAGGNTILAIDHHPLVSQQADWFIRLGPGSGRLGGQVISMSADKPALSQDIDIPAGPSPRSAAAAMAITAAAIHNLEGLDLNIPAQGLTVLCGVSGSGKSTLLHRVIHESALAGRAVHCQALEGLERFSQVHAFSPANPLQFGAETLAEFMAVDSGIFKQFLQAAAEPNQRARLDKMLRNGATARSCSQCNGRGDWTTDLDYLGSFSQTCPNCRGSGLAAELGALRLQGKSLADFLSDDIDALGNEAIACCRLDSTVAGLREFALGHLSLGRRLRGLSGGELQRLRLARLFLNLEEAPCLLLLDEPDSGLGVDECRQLIDSLKKRLQRGHAAVVISHHPLMMCRADYLIDLGPGAGAAGGRVTACGTPFELLTGHWPLSKTAAYLKQLSHPAPI